MVVTRGTITPPLVAVDDEITVAPNTTVIYDVTGNDSGMQGAYSIGSLTTPSLGTAVTSGAHSISYLYESTEIPPVLTIALVGSSRWPRAMSARRRSSSMSVARATPAAPVRCSGICPARSMPVI